MQFFTYILTPIYFCFFAVILVVLHPIQIISHWIFGKAGLHKIVSLMIYLQIKNLLILGVRIKYHNFKTLHNYKTLLFVGNHQSMYDMPPLMWYFRKKNIRFIAKNELARFVPTVSYYLRNGYALLIDRKKGDESISKIAKEAEVVKNEGGAIAIYPEGTRSKDFKVKNFKLGGISKVHDIIPDILVIPLAIQNTGLMENRGKFGFKLGQTIHITMLEPRRLSKENLRDDIKKIEGEIKDIVESN